MSFLTVSHVSHSFGGRQILEDVSFKLEKGEHIGLVGANGEGKSTFFNLITNNLLPDDGQITWPGKIKVGYLDQMSSLENGKTIRDVLRTAFNEDFAAEQEMLELYDKMAEADEDTMNKMLARVGEIQSRLEHSGFYSLDSQIEDLCQWPGPGRYRSGQGCSGSFRRTAQQGAVGQAAVAGFRYSAAGRAHQLSGCGAHPLAYPLPAELRKRFHPHLP